MPLPMLNRVRKHTIESLKWEVEHNREHNIQYRSDLNKDTSLLRKLKQKKTGF